MKVVPLTTDDKSTALEVLDTLRSAIEKGEVVAFCAVGIEPDDCTRMWASSTKKVTRLRMIGALTHLTHSYINDVE
jgi:D-Tyr-tRNAtyr deacylase